jgi:general transcription factor 3C polypeptide 6
MSETLEKDKKLGQEEEEVEEEEYVLLELGDCLYSDISPGAPFVLSVSWFFSRSTSLRLTCYVLCHSIIEYLDLQLSLDFFVHRLYVRLLSWEKHVFQGLDTLTPTLIVGNGLKMVSHVLVMFSVLCTISLGCGLWVVAVLFH